MKDWKNEFRNKCVGKVDGESFAFVPLTEEFISNLLQQEKELSFKEGRASMGEEVGEKIIKRINVYSPLSVHDNTIGPLISGMNEVLAIINQLEKE